MLQTLEEHRFSIYPSVWIHLAIKKKRSFVGYAARYFHKNYTGVYVKYPLFLCWILMKLEFSRQIFEK